MSEKIIFAFFGNSGSGKTTIQNILFEKYNVAKIPTNTTRKMRPGEIEGVDYCFKSIFNFFHDDYIEYDFYANNIYGLTFSSIENSFKKSNACSVSVTLNGLKILHKIDKSSKKKYRKLKHKLGFDQIIFVNLSILNDDIILDRLIERGSSKEVIQERLNENLKQKEEMLKYYNLFDYDLSSVQFEKNLPNIMKSLKIERKGLNMNA